MRKTLYRNQPATGGQAWLALTRLLDFPSISVENENEVVMTLENFDLPPLSERIRAGQADPISPLELEICDRIKAKYEARYGAEKAAQLASPRWEMGTRDRIKTRFIALYGAQRARELAGDRWEAPSADAQPRSLPEK